MKIEDRYALGMWKHVRRVGAFAGLIGGAIVKFATNPLPVNIKVADGIVSGNLKYLGWSDPPSALATGAADHTFTVAGAIMLLFGIGCALSWAWDSKKGKLMPIDKNGRVVSDLNLSKFSLNVAGDAYTNTGTNNGHMGPVNNYGKMPFVLTQEIADYWVEVTKNWPAFEVSFHGTNRESADVAATLHNYLVQHGVTQAKLVGGVMMQLGMEFHGPITQKRGFGSVYGIGPVCLVVDVDK